MRKSKTQLKQEMNRVRELEAQGISRVEACNIVGTSPATARKYLGSTRFMSSTVQAPKETVDTTDVFGRIKTAVDFLKSAGFSVTPPDWLSK